MEQKYFADTFSFRIEHTEIFTACKLVKIAAHKAINVSLAEREG